MQCNEVRNYFADYLKERLASAAQEELSRHLKECAACNAELEEFTDLWVKLGALPTVAMDQPKSAEAVARVHGLVEGYKHGSHQGGKRWRPTLLTAAAAVLILFMSAVVIQRLAAPSGPGAVVEAAEGPLYRTAGGQTESLKVGQTVGRGEIVSTAESAGAVLVLEDGSRVEMRGQSKISFEGAGDIVRIRVNAGSVIVTGAGPNRGMYAETRELKVRVGGTVFLISAEEAGSRVAAIGGEVRVEQGNTEKKLLPGEQVSTSPMVSPPVREEIAWSRNAEAYLVLLQQSAPVSTKVAAAPLEFAAASIKPFSPGSSLYPGSVGFACHGIDGTHRALFGNGSLIAPQGRCVGSGNVYLADVIGFAYGKLGGQSVQGGPDWLRPAPPPPRPGALTFQIDAVAENPSTATLEQLRQMLQTMLADRLKLKVHPELQEYPGYALLVSRNGLKAKLKEVSDGEESPGFGTNDKGQLVIKGKSTLDKLAQILSQFVGAPVVDKTGLTGIYEYEFLRSSGQGGGARGAPEPGRLAGPRPASDKAADISALMEEPLGLRLQSERVSIEVIVIDQVEPPSPN